MCLEESFCPFTRDALNFQQPNIYAALHRTTQQCSGYTRSSIITAPCDAPLYHSAQLPLMLTGKAPTRKVYVTLVYLFLFAVALLCCDMLWYS